MCPSADLPLRNRPVSPDRAPTAGRSQLQRNIITIDTVQYDSVQSGFALITEINMLSHVLAVLDDFPLVQIKHTIYEAEVVRK